MISVVIPVKNGDLWVENCIKGIMSQTLFAQTEIIVIDSGSTDKTLDILKNLPVQVHAIPSTQFNHGSTRNLGVSFCKGEYVVMTVQDAIPTDERWLESMLIEFKDSSVAGVCGVQIVAHDPDKNPLRWYKPVSQPQVRKYHFSPSEFEQLTPQEKRIVCAWDNVTAMYRREVLKKIPFTNTVFGEDMIWAKEAFLAGYTLVYNPMAKVYHYHNENFDYTFKRALTSYYFRFKEFRLVPDDPSATLKEKLKMLTLLLRSKGLTARKKWHWWKYNLEAQGGIEKAFRVFSDALGKGELELDRIHELHCNTPPVPIRTF